MDLPEELLRGIYSYGFEKPSAIQQRAIKPTMMARDLIAQAQSGTVCLILLLLQFVRYSVLQLLLLWKDEPCDTPSFESEKSHTRTV